MAPRRESSSIFIGRSISSFLSGMFFFLFGFAFGAFVAYGAVTEVGVGVVSWQFVFGVFLALGCLWCSLIAFTLTIELSREGLRVNSLFQSGWARWDEVREVGVFANPPGYPFYGLFLKVQRGEGRSRGVGVACFLSGKPRYSAKAILEAVYHVNPSVKIHGFAYFGLPPYNLPEVQQLFAKKQLEGEHDEREVQRLV